MVAGPHYLGDAEGVSIFLLLVLLSTFRSIDGSSSSSRSTCCPDEELSSCTLVVVASSYQSTATTKRSACIIRLVGRAVHHNYMASEVRYLGVVEVFTDGLV